ncbi:MAG: DUF4349 domain-containing protein [Actinobacteria bacterium]|nr:MAG: DUF4349 domain-containing protein [Actinomycetota bacterium]
METPRDEQLAADLKALRPTPRPEFTAELDKRAAAGFPRRSHWRWTPFERLRSVKPRRLLIPAGGVAILAIAMVTAVVVSTESEDSAESLSKSSGSSRDFSEESGTGLLAKPERIAKPAPEAEGATEEAEAGVSSAAAGAVSPPAVKYFDGSGPYIPANLNPQKRAVERNAEVVLGADPADVADDSADVFEAVHAHDGIVLRSSTREGEPGLAGARFELLIPSGKLGDALAALSAIDEVRTRHEATNDITAPTVTTGELLQDSKARVDSLLAQLEAAETESEREAVEAELAQERRHRARLRTQLQHLERRADFSRVLVRIETGDSEQSADEGGAWGVGDALDDAGHILAVAAAVAVVALAILGPIALIALLAWLAHRAWLRRERRRVLS